MLLRLTLVMGMQGGAARGAPDDQPNELPPCAMYRFTEPPPPPYCAYPVRAQLYAGAAAAPHHPCRTQPHARHAVHVEHALGSPGPPRGGPCRHSASGHCQT